MLDDKGCLVDLDDLADDQLLLIALDGDEEATKLWAKRRFGDDETSETDDNETEETEEER